MVIEVEGLVKSFRGRTALAGVSLQVDPDEIVLLLGPRGAGKTTLLRICAGVLEPDAGRARIFKLDTAIDRARAQERLGYMPAGAPVDPDVTPWSALRRLAAARGFDQTRIRHAVREAATAAGLNDEITRRGRALSPLERRLAALAAALVPDPVALLLDDPFAGLDDAAAEVFAGRVRAVAAGRAVLIASGVTEPAVRLAHRVVRIGAGGVIEPHAAAAPVSAPAPLGAEPCRGPQEQAA